MLNRKTWLIENIGVRDLLEPSLATWAAHFITAMKSDPLINIYLERDPERFNRSSVFCSKDNPGAWPRFKHPSCQAKDDQRILSNKEHSKPTKATHHHHHLGQDLLYCTYYKITRLRICLVSQLHVSGLGSIATLFRHLALCFEILFWSHRQGLVSEKIHLHA